MKEYLSLNERNTWLASIVLVTYNENLIEVWKKNLTTDEVRKLKTSITMTKNALKSILDRIPIKERNRMITHSKDFEVRILSNAGARVLENRADKENETVEINRNKLEKIIHEVMITKCANCRINCDDCRLYIFSVESMIPRFETEKNCPFAFKTIEHKKMSRKDKKQKNRYDATGDDYKYDIKLKGGN